MNIEDLKTIKEKLEKKIPLTEEEMNIVKKLVILELRVQETSKMHIEANKNTYRG